MFNVSFKLTCQNISRQTQAQEEIVLSESYNTREAAYFNMAHVMISTYSTSFLVLIAQLKEIRVQNVYQKHTADLLLNENDILSNNKTKHYDIIILLIF